MPKPKRKTYFEQVRLADIAHLQARQSNVNKGIPVRFSNLVVETPTTKTEPYSVRFVNGTRR